jgi:hypothetical protein
MRVAQTGDLQNPNVTMSCPLTVEISPTECKSGTSQKLLFGVHITNEIKNVTTTLDETSRLVSSEPPDAVRVECSYILELNCSINCKLTIFLDCAAIA